MYAVNRFDYAGNRFNPVLSLTQNESFRRV